MPTLKEELREKIEMYEYTLNKGLNNKDTNDHFLQTISTLINKKIQECVKETKEYGTYDFSDDYLTALDQFLENWEKENK